MMKKLLITGEMRSGTTLIANFLNAQENITVYRDFLHLERLRRRVGISSLTSHLSHVQRTELIVEFCRDNAELGNVLGSELYPENFDTLVEFYLGVLQRIAAPGDTVVGHKTTVAHDIVGELLGLVPDLKVVYMLRDPRDVVVSALKRFSRRVPIDYIKSWQQAYIQIEKCKSDARLSSRIMLIRYEELVLQSNYVLDKLTEFLECDDIVVPERMSDYGKAWQANSSFDGVEGVLDPTPVGRWQELNPMVGRITEALLGAVMVEAGYKISRDVSSLEMILVQSLCFAYFPIRRILGLIRRLLQSCF